MTDWGKDKSGRLREGNKSKGGEGGEGGVGGGGGGGEGGAETTTEGVTIARNCATVQL